MRFNINKSLSSRIVFYLLSFCVVLFLILLSTFYYLSKRQIEIMTYKNAEAIANNTVLKAEQVLVPITKIANNYKWIVENMELHSDSVYGITRRIVENNPEVLGSAIAFEPRYFREQGYYFSPYSYRENDSIKTIQLGNRDYEYFIMDWYQIPMMTGTPYWTEPYFDTGGGNALMTTYSVPFFRLVNGERKAAGIITIDLALDWFTDIVSSVKILETGYASVISKNGTFITHPNKDWIMNETIFSVASELDNPELRSIGREMQKGNTGIVSSTLRGVERKLYFTPLPLSNWTMAVIFPKHEMYAPLRSISITLIVLISVGLLMLTWFVYKIVSKQLAPLSVFARSAHEVAEGNFAGALPDINTRDEMKDLHDSFVRMQKDLQTFIENLKSTTSAKEKIESELRIAREIQMGMIPKIFPPFPNLTEIDLFAMMEPAKEVGGDLYDFFLIDETHLCFAIGDVSGKGVPASLFMAITRTLLRTVAPNQRSTREIVNTLNKSLSQGNDSNMFVTFFIGILNVETGQLFYTNAGHNPPAIIHAGEKIELFEVTKDIPIGLFEEFNYTEKERIISKDDKIFLYTDGITEAENCNQELYSEARLIDCLATVSSNEPIEVVMGVARDVVIHVNDYLQSDDLTMMCIVYYGKD
jgi:sigma-B regulation protein RsbU (phosphoserine phosphatase)